MTTVFVTGGTGFLGSNLAVALLERGCHVRILRRSTSPLTAIGDAPVEHVIGDVCDPASLARAMKGCDTVFHTAAIVSYWRREREKMYDVNIRGTAHVVAACLTAGVRKLVHTSSIAAIGFDPHGGVADERTSFNWEKFDVGYRISKHRAEGEVLRGVALGLQAVLVNPSVIIGPRDIHFHGGQLIRDVAKRRIFYYPDGGLNIVDVDDVVRGHIAAAEVGRVGERYILGGTNMTHREAIAEIASVVGGFPPLFKIPSPMVRWIGRAAEGIANLTGISPWVSRELMAGVGTRSWFSCAKAARELGYTITPYRESVTRTFRWYRDHGLL